MSTVEYCIESRHTVQNSEKRELMINKYKHTVKDILEDIYLEFYNNYLTVEKFADDNNIAINEALLIVGMGRKVNRER